MKLNELNKKREQYQTEGNILKEIEILREILTETEKLYASESDEYIKALNELGGTLKYVGYYDEAEANLQKSLEIIRKKYGDNNLPYATSLLNLTEVYRFAQKFNLLEENYKKIVKIYQDNSADNTFPYAGLCNNFGLYYQNVGDMKAAYDLHLKSLDVLENYDSEEYLLEYAVTLSNLFNPCYQLGMKEKAVEYLYKAIEIFEKNVGKEHPLYSASLNNMAIYYYNERQLDKAIEFFEKAAEISKKTMGLNSDNYKNILSNIEFIKEELGKSSGNNISQSTEFEEKNEHIKNLTKEDSKDIKGLELSKRYFYDIVLPEFEKHLSDILPLCAFGLVGEGSECYAYDDKISQDHDFGPSVCIWLEKDDYLKYEDKINEVLKTLPKAYLGFQELKESEWGSDRRGLLNIEDFYFKFLGSSKVPRTIAEWQKIPETALATATNGEIFLDNLGEFSRIRKELLNYYPEPIRQNKIATRLMNISQHGQYNYTRCLKRNDLVAANQCLYLFVD
jgi:tetratricopeptide repeat protein